MKTCASLFSGGGGWELGAMRAGLTPLWAIEHDPAIAAVYRRNIGRHVTVRAVQDVSPCLCPPVDVLFASPPCQGHSNARDRNLPPRDDDGVGIYCLDFVRILRPRVFMLENVPPYQHHPIFKQIVDGLFALGYFVHYDVLNAADYGVPQTRRRLILRAVRDGLVPMLPTPTPWRGWYEAIADLIPTLPVSKFAPWQLMRLPEMYSSTLIDRCNVTSETWCLVGGNQNMPRAFLVDSKNAGQEWGKKYRADDEPVFTITTDHAPRAFLVDCQKNGSADDGMRGLTNRQATEPTFTITASANKRTARAWLDHGRVVSMTPRALARLQSVPDDYELPDSSALACRIIGNMVPPEMARRLVEVL